MEKITKQLRWLLASLMLVVGVGSAWGEDITISYGWEDNDDATAWTITDAIAKTSGQGNTGTYAGKINSNHTYVQFKNKVYVKSFSFAFKRTSNNNNYFVYIETSTDGTNWTAVETYAMSDFNNGSYLTKTQTFDGTTECYVRFHCYNTTAVRYVDDVSITYSTSASTVAAPTFNPVDGTTFGNEGLTVTLSQADNKTIYYTLDGSDPDNTSTQYSGAINLTTTTTIKAIAYDGTNTSSVVEATYTFIDPNGPGTQNNPYTVAQARAAIDANTGITDVYATGIVSKIVTAYNSKYGNISFNISEDGSETEYQLQAYRCFNINGEWFTSADDVQVGDVVVIYGSLSKHNNTYEFAQNCHLVSLERPEQAMSFDETSYTATLGTSFTAPMLNNPNSLSVTFSSSTEAVATINPSTGAITLVAAGMTTITATAGNKTAHYKLFVIDPNNGIETNPYTVAQALEYIGHLGTETSPVDIYVRGIVSNSGLNGNYVVYYISDDGTDDTHLYVYGGKGLEGAPLANGDVQQGDEVTVYGKLVNYHSTTPEFTSGNQIVAFNRPEKKNPDLSFGETTEFTITVGDEFTEPTLINPNQLSVTYSGDNNQLAMVDEDTGALTFVENAIGTITVTATFAGNTQYNAGTATYTLTVEEEPAVVITPNPKNINSEYYEKVTDMSELEDGDAIILVVENGTASQAMGTTTTNGAYRPSYGLATHGTYDWENSTVQLNDEGKADIEKIVLVKEGDLFYLYATRTATLTGFLYANNYGLYVDSNNTNLADNHKAAISIDATGNASITFQGDTTKPLFGRTSSGWSSFASGTTLDNMQIYVERSVLTPATGDYVKVESANDLTDGEYLIVYEDGSLAFDGSLETLDAVENTIGVTIGNKTIASSETVDAATFTIDTTEGTIKSASGYYIGQTTDANGLLTSDETAYTNTINIDEDGNVDIVSGGAHLRFNANSDQKRFRYFKSSTYTNQKAIALYKKQDTSIETVELFASQYCYKTMAAPYDMDLTGSDLKAYIVTLNNEQTEAEFDRVYRILAGTPIVIHADAAGKYELTKAVSGDDMDNVSKNRLLESDGKKVVGDGTVFVLNKVNDTLGFYPLKSGNTLAAGKCYLSIDRNAGAKFIGFTIDGEGTATGIETVESKTGKVQGTIYDLQGRRVAVPVHGLYIVNGKKVFVK